jgi:hypothetical protein
VRVDNSSFCSHLTVVAKNCRHGFISVQHVASRRRLLAEENTSRAGEGLWQTPVWTLGIHMLNLGNPKAFLGPVYPLGNTIWLPGLLPISRKMKIYPWDLHSTFLAERKLALGTHWLDLGAVALLGPYFWTLESISCLLGSQKALTRHPHQTSAQN